MLGRIVSDRKKAEQRLDRFVTVAEFGVDHPEIEQGQDVIRAQGHGFLQRRSRFRVLPAAATQPTLASA